MITKILKNQNTKIGYYFYIDSMETLILPELPHHNVKKTKTLSNFDSKSQVLDPIWETLASDYEIKGFLGEGVNGTVMKAIHRETKKTVAIKLMRNLF